MHFRNRLQGRTDPVATNLQRKGGTLHYNGKGKHPDCPTILTASRPHINTVYAQKIIALTFSFSYILIFFFSQDKCTAKKNNNQVFSLVAAKHPNFLFQD